MGQDGDSIIEVRNGSDMVLKQQVWGPGYVDELVQEGINSAPTSQSTCDTFYWACQDANYNVMGLVDSTGVLKERYEYTPYGERKVLFSPGVNDTDLMAPTLMSRRVQVGGANQPYGLCEFGHQGLYHDEELGLIYNRARQLHPTLGRFMQRDPLGYADSANVYQYLEGEPTHRNDPSGRSWMDRDASCGKDEEGRNYAYFPMDGSPDLVETANSVLPPDDVNALILGGKAAVVGIGVGGGLISGGSRVVFGPGGAPTGDGIPGIGSYPGTLATKLISVLPPLAEATSEARYLWMRVQCATCKCGRIRKAPPKWVLLEFPDGPEANLASVGDMKRAISATRISACGLE